MVMGDLDIGTRPETLPTKEKVAGVTVQDIELGPKRPNTSIYSILEKVLIMLGKVYLELRPTLKPPIIQVIMVYHLVFIVTEIIEVEKGLTPANLLHITMMD